MTFILILSLLNGSSGGAAISQIEFSGEHAEVRCEAAGEKWVKKTNSFDVDARYTCVKLQY